jgi:hypothetical protein
MLALIKSGFAPVEGEEAFRLEETTSWKTASAAESGSGLLPRRGRGGDGAPAPAGHGTPARCARGLRDARDAQGVMTAVFGLLQDVDALWEAQGAGSAAPGGKTCRLKRPRTGRVCG